MPVRKKSKNGRSIKKPRRPVKKRSVKRKPIRRKPIRRKSKKKSTKKNHKRSRKRTQKIVANNLFYGGKKYISQKEPYDCVVACISMFTDKPYNYIRNKYFKDQDFSYNTDSQGVGLTKEISVLKIEGFDVKDISPELPPRNSIVTVPSLNYKNSLHAIFWDGATIFDPNTAHSRKPYNNTKIYTHEMFINEPYKQPIVSTY